MKIFPSTFALVAFLATAASAAPALEVGKADWSKMPKLVSSAGSLPYEEMVGGVEQLLASGQCEIRGQSYRRFDINVPYAVKIDASGAASRIVVAEMGCKPLESLVGNLVADMAERGDFRGATKPGWYSSKINFTQE